MIQCQPLFGHCTNEGGANSDGPRRRGLGGARTREKGWHYGKSGDPNQNGADAKQSTMDRLRHALEAAGIEFINGDQPGVRLIKAAAAKMPKTKKGRFG